MLVSPSPALEKDGLSQAVPRLHGPNYCLILAIEGKAAAALRTSLELFLLSFARSAVQLERAGQSLDDLIHAWSSTYGRMLQKS